MIVKLPLAISDQFALIDDHNYPWASRHTWWLGDDGHPFRFGTDRDGNPAVVYLCNEVVSRATGTPLYHFPPPRPAPPPGEDVAVGLVLSPPGETGRSLRDVPARGGPWGSGQHVPASLAGLRPGAPPKN